MKKASVNGQEISEGAVRFEFDRLVKFYKSHGISDDEIGKSREILEEKALEQAIGAKLLLDRAEQLHIPVSASDVDAEVAKVVAQVGGEGNYRKILAAQGLDETLFRKELEKGARVNKLVEQACAEVPEPTEDEVAGFFAANKGDFGAQTLVDVHDQIRDLLRHQARGHALDAFVAELKAAATIVRE